MRKWVPITPAPIQTDKPHVSHVITNLPSSIVELRTLKLILDIYAVYLERLKSAKLFLYDSMRKSDNPKKCEVYESSWIRTEKELDGGVEFKIRAYVDSENLTCICIYCLL